MKISVLGTGMVGRTIAERLAELGHEVVIGTRDVDATMARTEPDGMGNPPFAAWHRSHDAIGVASFAEASARGELVVNATAGGASLSALEAAGAANLDGKVLLDIANPLDFSGGLPPSLSIVNTDSLGEQIQRAFPGARVVKSLNTMNCLVMVHPERVPGDHHVFVASDDADAKAAVTSLLGEFGWPRERVLDLGPLSSARGAEMYLPLWLSLMRSLGTADFNVAVVRA